MALAAMSMLAFNSCKNEEQEPQPSLTQGIEQEVEGNLIHSKGYKTSLGADDGIWCGVLPV